MTGISRGTTSAAIRGVRLSEWTTLELGGPADLFVEVGDVASLSGALDDAQADGRPVLVLGGGSNLVVSDEGFPGTVLRVAIKGVAVERDFDGYGDGPGALVRAGAGEDWAGLVSLCVAEGLSGIECLSGIPGLVGGAPVQNIGAYGQEVADTIVAVRVWDRHERRALDLAPLDCGFAYRESIFKRGSRYVVTEVTFRLLRSGLSQPLRYAELARHLGRELDQAAPLGLTAQAVLDLRRGKGMVLDGADPDTRSAGSFFTNPVLDDPRLARLREVAPGVPTFPRLWGPRCRPPGWSKRLALTRATAWEGRPSRPSTPWP